MIDEPIGEPLSRNLGSPTAPGEAVEAELDRLITRRHDTRVSSEGERQAEEMWQESVKRYEEKRRQGFAAKDLPELVGLASEAKPEGA